MYNLYISGCFHQRRGLWKLLCVQRQWGRTKGWLSFKVNLKFQNLSQATKVNCPGATAEGENVLAFNNVTGTCDWAVNVPGCGGERYCYHPSILTKDSNANFYFNHPSILIKHSNANLYFKVMYVNESNYHPSILIKHSRMQIYISKLRMSMNRADDKRKRFLLRLATEPVQVDPFFEYDCAAEVTMKSFAMLLNIENERLMQNN